MTELLPGAPSIDQLTRIIGGVAAPAFLLGAVGAFVAILISRIDRVINRAQFLNRIDRSDVARSALKSDVPRIRRRAALLNRSLFYSLLSAILTSLIVIVAFVSAMFRAAHEYGVAILFTAALCTFCMSLIDLTREVRIALHDNDLHA
jgi:hypothetical protein